MLEQVLLALDVIDDFFWTYLGVPALIGLGLYLSFKSGWFQLRNLPIIIKNFLGDMFASSTVDARGISPIYAFFASVGGCVGVGNIVGVCTAIQIGGPGALFWLWVSGLLGMMVKYAEIYLGVKYRVANGANSYDGGPMFYLQRAFSGNFIPALFCFLLAIYGTEIYIFNTVVQSITTSWHLNRGIVIICLLGLVLFVGRENLGRVGRLSSKLLSLFLLFFTGAALWVFINHIQALPAAFATIFRSAFAGHAAIGGFTGSSFMLALSQGVKRACYTGDLGIGYASVIHSESREKNPGRQASLGIFEIFLDTFIVCTLSLLLVLLTGVWQSSIPAVMLVPAALKSYFPLIDFIWPVFIFLLGYSTLISYFSVGKKAALFLSPRYGARLYVLYSIAAFLLFAFCANEMLALSVMSITGMLLLSINVAGMFRLRNEIVFRSGKNKDVVTEITGQGVEAISLQKE